MPNGPSIVQGIKKVTGRYTDKFQKYRAKAFLFAHYFRVFVISDPGKSSIVLAAIKSSP